ncbi:MAG TPA: SGNH/GDSL hydrolase family protein [Sedimentisphaerales bacterium]|nr:SGNH/GDSL hydrolase family protein [Sedimentisphaerales bacterium]
MKKHILRITTVLTILSLSVVGCTDRGVDKPIRVQDYRETIRVACVGDSITYGSSINNRLRNSYPAQLGKMLGEKWQVRNFGVGGATLLKKGDKPYWKQKAFEGILAFNPHVVVIKLGTNDTKPQNWKFKDEFAGDYAAMIERFAALPSKPRVWLCYPVPAYPERWGISDATIKNEVIPLIAGVARREHVPIINLYTPLSGRPGLFPDLIHPNAEGAHLIAKEVYVALTGSIWTGGYEEAPLPRVLIIGDSISIGYFKPLQKLLEGKAIVEHNAGNAAHTANGLAKLDEWLGDTRWDVIHFNHGLHDLKYVDEQGKNTPVEKGKPQIPIEQYEKNLDELVTRLEKTGARLIFATTTPVPDGTGIRVKGDAEKYNVPAERVMNKHGVTIDDLYSFALPRLGEIQQPQNVHFTQAGSELLAKQVADCILKALDDQ